MMSSATGTHNRQIAKGFQITPFKRMFLISTIRVALSSTNIKAFSTKFLEVSLGRVRLNFFLSILL